MYKQIIIARKDLNMSAGKLAAQVSHASMAFLTNTIRRDWSMNTTYFKGDEYKTYYSVELTFDKDLFEQWIIGEFTKCVLKAKNKSQLLKAKTLAEEIQVIDKRLAETEITRNTADDFIRDIKKYLNAPELTREMCYELIDRIIVGGSQSVTGKEREIDIVYKVDIVSVLRHRLK